MAGLKTSSSDPENYKCNNFKFQIVNNATFSSLIQQHASTLTSVSTVTSLSGLVSLVYSLGTVAFLMWSVQLNNFESEIVSIVIFLSFVKASQSFKAVMILQLVAFLSLLMKNLKNK